MLVCQTTIQTLSFGLAASMGAFLLGAGTRGKRYSLPNSRIMIHQPIGGASGAAVDVEIQAREIMYHKANLNRIMSSFTGQSSKRIEKDTDRDRYMSPVEAKEYGIIDKIISRKNVPIRVDRKDYLVPTTKKDYTVWAKSEYQDSQ